VTEYRKPQVGDVVPDHSSTNRLAKKRESTKKELEDAFQSYQNNEPGSRNNLLTLTRKFIYGKLYGLELDSGFKALGTSETAEDWTQDTLLDVWRKVDAGLVRGSYYAFVNKVTYFDKKDALGYLVEQKKEKVSLDVEVGEDAYSGEVDPDASTENPAIYNERAPRPNLPSDFTFAKSMLNGVEGKTRWAAELMLSGWSLKHAAEHHGLTEAALKMRFKRIRERMGIEAKEIKRSPKSAPLPMLDAVNDEENAA
jgi:DNA-directed RNA polymerase specialized sigma24 family protein